MDSAYISLIYIVLMHHYNQAPVNFFLRFLHEKLIRARVSFGRIGTKMPDSFSYSSVLSLMDANPVLLHLLHHLECLVLHPIFLQETSLLLLVS